MSEPVFQDEVAIDTNVFEHLLNDQHNPEGHINRLLEYLSLKRMKLLVDDRNVIGSEYLTHIIPMLRGKSVKGNELNILRYWTNLENRVSVPIPRNHRLMTAIEKVIVEPPKVADRTFVFVAFRRGKILISNDYEDIIIGPARENRRPHRRDRLLREAKRWLEEGADILISEEAWVKIDQR